MTRDPHCDGCKADDKLRALRRERDELQARLDALGEPVTEHGYGDDVTAMFHGYRLNLPATHVRTAYRSPWRPVSPETTP